MAFLPSGNSTTMPSTTIAFLPSETFKTFSLWSEQDDIVEGTECLSFFLEPMDEFANVINETLTVCIEDDDSEYTCT